jgi:oligoribonuclease NrnB/cAMP/cGMP phosphodiesterase (DHH superfamily)
MKDKNIEMGQDKVCVFHANCLDGFTSAWIVKQHFPEATFVEGNYNRNLDIEKFRNKDVIFVDFSTKANILSDIADIAHSVLIIDHHVSAEKELGMLGDELPNVEVIFDMKKSGAMLTWEFYNDEPAPFIVKLVQDRDLWTFNYPETKPAMAYARTLDMSFKEWDKLMNESIDHLVEMGTVLYNAKQKDVKYLVNNCAFKGMIAGEEVLIANIPYIFSSEAGHEMVNRFGKFAVTYFISKDGKYNYSFRANDEYDVSELAAKFGGGGHPNAAGCVTDFPIWEDMTENVPSMKDLVAIGKKNGPRGAEGTSEPIWLFQVKDIWIPEYLGDMLGDQISEEKTESLVRDNNAYEYWKTDSVFLSREEAEEYGKHREYEWGEDGWRVYCISLWRTNETKHILSAIDVKNLESRRVK